MSAQRWAAAAGVLYVVLDVVVGVMAGEPPAPGAPPSEITTYIAGHHDGVAVGLWLFGLASVALMWWFGSLWRLLVEAEDGAPRLAVVSLAGLVLGGAMALASATVTATLGLVDAGASTTAFYALAAVLLSASGFGLGAHLLATNVVAVRSGLLATWLSGLGLLSAVAFLVAAVLGAIDDTSISNTISLAGFVMWLLWILGVSARMWRGEVDAPEHLEHALSA